MSNLDLKIVTAERDAVILADSGFGEAVEFIAAPLLEEMIDGARELRSIYEGALREGSGADYQRDIATYGEHLFATVFKGSVLELLNRTIGGSRSARLNIRLMLGEPQLNSIQWEVMRFGSEYVGFRHNLFRHPFVLRPLKVPEVPSTILRVLHVAVDPLYGPKTIWEESEAFIALFRGFGDHVEVRSLRQEEATLDNVVEELFSGADIFHFTGHGTYDRTNPLDSSLVLWGRGSEQFSLLSIRSLRMLATSLSLGFCFLNACNTARTTEAPPAAKPEVDARSEYFVNMAHALIEAGIPMVVATNHEITVGGAARLSRRFYTSVVKYGRRVDQALSEARAELFLGGPGILISDWSCPVLYTRSRYNELATERFQWGAGDIYTARNIERPASVQRVRER